MRNEVRDADGKPALRLVGGGDSNGHGGHTGGHEPPGGDGVETRVAKLETHVEYIRRDLDVVLADVRTIKSRMAYFAGAAAVVALVLGWLANNRFEQILGLIAK